MLLRPSAYKIRSSPAHSRKRPSACISYAILSSAAVELWLFGCKKEGNFLALDFRSKIPYMFLQLHLILMPVNTQRHTDGCMMLLQLHSPWRKLQSVQVLPADSLLLHASALYPSHRHTQSNVPWMDGFPSFLSPNYKSATRGCKHLEMCRAICQLLGIITHH